MNDNHWPEPRKRAINPYTLSLGLLSVACGGAMLVAPRLFGALFSLPERRALVRLLGACDLVIGGAVLAPATRRVGLVLRSLADASDSAMIAFKVARGETKALRGGVSLAAAGLSAATATRLALRRSAF